MLDIMPKNTEKSRSELPIRPSIDEKDENAAVCLRLKQPPSFGPTIGQRRRSYSVNRDIPRARQGIALTSLRSDPVSQFFSGDSRQRLDAHDPHRSAQFDRRGQPRKSRVSARFAQWSHDARGVEGQIDFHTTQYGFPENAYV